MSGGFPANHLYGNTDHAVCPYCETKIYIDEPEPEGSSDQECPECEKKFRMNTRYSVEYDAVGDCEKNNQMPHELELTCSHVKRYTCRKCKGEWYDWHLPNGSHPKLSDGDFVIVCEKVEDLI